MIAERCTRQLEAQGVNRVMTIAIQMRCILDCPIQHAKDLKESMQRAKQVNEASPLSSS